MLITDRIDGVNVWDTREEVARPGPYCDGMAMVLERESGSGDFYGGEEGGAWCEVFGRRVLWVDSQGFRSSERYASHREATAMAVGAFGTGECEILVEVERSGFGAEVVGICPADGRPIYRSAMAGTIYHASDDGA